MNHFMIILRETHKIDIRNSNKNKYKFLLKCQELKHDLEAAEEVILDVDDYDPNIEAHIPITREEFKELSNEMLVRLNAKILEALDSINLSPNQINYVLQVGGCCRMAMIKELLRNIFPNSEHRSTVDPDWAVAQGASLYCCHLQSQNMEKTLISSNRKKSKPKSECVGWDCGAGAIRIANINTLERPKPQLIKDASDNPHFLAITSMQVPPTFHESALLNPAAHIVMDAFRCQPTKSDYLFCVERKNDEYIIPSHRRLMKNNPTPQDLEDNGIPEKSQSFKHEEIMASIIQEVSKAFNVRNVSQKEVYICVPDAASLDHIRKLRRAFIEVFKKRQKAAENPKLKQSGPPPALRYEGPLTNASTFFIQRTAAAIQMYFHQRSGDKVYDHYREQLFRVNRVVPPYEKQIILPRTVVVIAFGAGHFSSAIYKQETFERYGIRHIFNQSDDALGGEDLCYRLCEYAANHEKLDDKGKEALKNARLQKFLRNTMDQAKIDLSGFTPAIVDVETDDDRVDTFEITREEFEKKIATKEFDKIENYVQELKSHTIGLDVTDILLVRGSTRTKRILDLVGHYFPDVPIVKSLITDECIVMGTALKGALRNGIHRTAYAEVEDVAMHDQWVEIDGIQLFLSKRFERVQNSKEHWIQPMAGHRMTYNGMIIGEEFVDPHERSKLKWYRDVAADPSVMTNGRIRSF